MTLAEVKMINESATTFIKEHKTESSNIIMAIYGDNASKYVYILMTHNGERHIQKPMSFIDIASSVTDLGGIDAVEIFTETGISIAFNSRGYKITRSSTGEIEETFYHDHPKCSIENDIGAVIFEAIKRGLWNA